MVPAGIPGTPEGDFLPPYDPAAARQLLAEAGYPGGGGSAPVSFIANGGGYDGAIIAMLEENLGVDDRLRDDGLRDLPGAAGRRTRPRSGACRGSPTTPGPTTSWASSWEPGPRPTRGAGRPDPSTTRSRDATSAADAEAATAAYADALAIVRDEAPVVPVSYGTSFSLVRDGLLGASQTGTGILRLAGLAWEAGR